MGLENKVPELDAADGTVVTGRVPAVVVFSRVTAPVGSPFELSTIVPLSCRFLVLFLPSLAFPFFWPSFPLFPSDIWGAAFGGGRCLGGNVA